MLELFMHFISCGNIDDDFRARPKGNNAILKWKAFVSAYDFSRFND